ncbi:MAG: helix-turn-helix domain-containing protein [Crocinitomicaceae bacterium]|nr:helix-turn-helix domain-containing protein [Crocinitomicaceae bacterium]
MQPQDFAEQFINYTNQSIFLTGKAGTGKTTFLKNIVQSTHKQTAIVAPTGIAALNAGGVTIHSFFQLPFAGFIPDFLNDITVDGATKLESKSTLMRHFRHNKKRQQLIRSLELLIIDEVSMLRADILDAIDWVLRNIRKINIPFGGVQILFIGDLHQLPPIVKPEEWRYLSKYYNGAYFFNSLALQEQPPLYIELKKIYRQQDDEFIGALNKLRNNQMDEVGLATINKKVIQKFNPADYEGYITLTTHNHKADIINQRELDLLKQKSYRFTAEITGDFPQHIYPIEPSLQLKKDAQVMFVKNDVSFDKQYYNGKMAKIIEINDFDVVVECLEDKKRIEVAKHEWENIRYKTDENTGEIKEEVIGTFVQYPLKLAWAITIHKSQGLTFEKAILDVGDVFAPGQAYVALSRLRSLNGLVMMNPLRINGINTDESVIQYAQNEPTIHQLQDFLPKAIKNNLYNQLIKTYDWLEMASNWASFEKDCFLQSKKSLKGELCSWAKAQNFTIQNTLEPARKFRNQLDNLFLDLNYSMEKVVERIHASVNYFLPILDNVYFSLVKKMIEVGRVKKTKALLEELQELEETLLEVILSLKKTVIVVQYTAEGRKIDKNTCFGDDIKNYRIKRVAKAKQSLISNNELFIASNQDDEEDSIFSKKETSKKKSASIEKKKPTSEITLELFESGLSIEQIAAQRQLTYNTINSHLADLIKNEKIVIEQVMDAELLSYLVRTIGKQNLTMSEMKEMVKDDVTYEDLKLYRAYSLL